VSTAIHSATIRRASTAKIKNATMRSVIGRYQPPFTGRLGLATHFATQLPTTGRQDPASADTGIADNRLKWISSQGGDPAKLSMLGIEGHSVCTPGAFVSAPVTVETVLHVDYPHCYATPWARPFNDIE
jgi:hypothetical protein